MELSKIARSRKDYKKPNKAECWLSVKHLIEQAQDDENIAELSALYSFFLPSTPAKPKTAEQWVMKAVPKKGIRYYLLNAYVSEGRLVGTDGHRLHILNGTNLVEGEFYDRALTRLDNSDKTYGDYPDINRVIPDCSKMEQGGFVEIDQIEQRLVDVAKPYNQSVFKVEKGTGKDKHIVEVAVNTSYLADAISFMSNPHWYVSQDAPQNSPILIKDEGGDTEAVIMPIRL